MINYIGKKQWNRNMMYRTNTMELICNYEVNKKKILTERIIAET